MERGVRGLENWTIFMDVICVSSLTRLKDGVTKKTHKIK